MSTNDYRRAARELREHRVAIRYHNNLCDALARCGPRVGEQPQVRSAARAFARQQAAWQTLADVSFNPSF
jgi:hypothetical protein